MISKRMISLGLSLVGVAGVGVTSWLSIKGHDKAREKTEKKDKLLAYAPAIGNGILTAACILGSHHVSSKEIAALTASCGYLAANRKKILEKVRGELGEEKAKQIQTQAALETKKELKTKRVIEETGYGHVHFIEDMFGREFYCSVEHFERAKKILEHMISNGENVNYNTFYELLGLSKTIEGWEYEWRFDDGIYGYSIDHPICIDRTPMKDSNGETCWLVSCKFTPPISRFLEEDMED